MRPIHYTRIFPMRNKHCCINHTLLPYYHMRKQTYGYVVATRRRYGCVLGWFIGWLGGSSHGLSPEDRYRPVIESLRLYTYCIVSLLSRFCWNNTFNAVFPIVLYGFGLFAEGKAETT